MKYWLLKSEPESYGITHLAADGTTPWTGVRNYQARNFMREMRCGDLGFFYHSNVKAPGIAGIITIVRECYPDFTAFDPKSEYYDPKATAATPRWEMVDVAFEAHLARYVTLEELRTNPRLHDLPLLQKGQRLSVQPVPVAHWKRILAISKKAPAVAP